MSAIGPKQTLAFALQMPAYDPKRTSPHYQRFNDEVASSQPSFSV